MNHKIFFVFVMMGWQSLISEGFAKDAASVASPARSSLTPQFYAGASLGVQRLTGKRSEVALYDNLLLVDLETISFANQKPFSNNNGCYAAHVGFTWNVPKTMVIFGPEIYLGRGSVTNDLKAIQIDANNFKRSLNASIRQQTFFGGALQVGLNCRWNLRPYLLLGLEKSQFEYSGIYIPRSQQGLANAALNAGPAVDYPDTLLNARKWLRGFLWGFGIEKDIHSIRIGADIRIIYYREFKTSQLATAFEPETLFSTFKPKNIRFGLKLSYIF
jgi:hypothetical protein